MASTPADPAVRPSRPRNRRQVIAQNASTLFVRRGFNAVRLEDIAAETGVTPRALYRHYESKQQLLSELVHESQARFLSAFSPDPDDGPAGSAEAALDGLVVRLASASLSSSYSAVLWQREARHLTVEDNASLRHRLGEMAGRIASMIGAARPGPSPVRARFDAWAVLAIVCSPGHDDLGQTHAADLPLLVAACRAAVAGDPATDVPARAPRRRPLVARREKIMAAAASAFRRSGFQAVGINEIGADAGIAGPSIYRYFATKADILVALIQRFYEWATLETLRALTTEDAGTGQDDPAAIVRRIVDGYVRLCAEAPDLVSVVVTESICLPADDRERLDRVRGDLHAEWVSWLVAARPELDNATAHALCRITTIMIEDTIRVRHLHEDPRLAPELSALAQRVMQHTRPGGDASVG